ncbi:MAG: hypothetical protein RLZZ574_2120, partial [Cyanobacteriota bacterium]
YKTKVLKDTASHMPAGDRWSKVQQGATFYFTLRNKPSNNSIEMYRNQALN